MTHNNLQTSKSVGNMSSVEGKATSPTGSILVTPGKTPSFAANKNNHVRWEERRPMSGGAAVPGTLQRSKSMTGASVKGPSPPRNSTQTNIVTPMGPMSQSDYVNIKHAIDGTSKLTSEEVMGIVKILIDRAIEGRNYAIIIAAACEKIIDNDDGMMFFESLINYCLFTLNKLKENTVNRKYNGIMGFVCELYLTMKSKQAMNGLGSSSKDSKKGLLSPCQSLLRLIVKCGHDVLNDPHLHLKPDQVESLFLTVMTVGQDVERELPTGMESLLAAIRDSFIANSRLTQIIKHKLLQIIETHASGWQLPAFTLMYYNATTH